MGKHQNNSLIQYLLVLCLSFMLIQSQTNKLHMHLEHDDHSSVATGHVVDLHAASILHDFEVTDYHDDHHGTVIDISPDNLVNKANSLNPLVLFLLIIGVFLYMPRLLCLPRQRRYKTVFIPSSYLILPPLRAPPIN